LGREVEEGSGALGPHLKILLVNVYMWDYVSKVIRAYLRPLRHKFVGHAHQVYIRIVTVSVHVDLCKTTPRRKLLDT
jgi:hypothetical protein